MKIGQELAGQGTETPGEWGPRSLIGGDPTPLDHKDPTNHGVQNPPTLGPQDQKVESLYVHVSIATG